jgi:deazaflavin-dependent oxidoreductase (nitroreductase family)
MLSPSSRNVVESRRPSSPRRIGKTIKMEENPMFKAMLKAMVAVMVFLYRLTGGAIGGKIQSLPVLLLTTTGRKSEKTRTVPVGFLRDGSNYVIIASYAGLLQNPAWYLNLKHRPEVTIQVKRQKMQVKAETANPEKRRELWTRLMEVAPGYANYQKRTSREIPVVILRLIDESRERKSA